MSYIYRVISGCDEEVWWFWSDGAIERTSKNGSVLSRMKSSVYQPSSRAAVFLSGNAIVIGSWDMNKIQCWKVDGGDLTLKWENELKQPQYFHASRYTNAIYCAGEDGTCIKVTEEGKMRKIVSKGWLVSEINNDDICLSFRRNLLHSSHLSQKPEKFLAREEKNISGLACFEQGAFYFSIGGLVRFWDRDLLKIYNYDQELGMHPSEISYNNKDHVVSIVYRDEENNSLVKAIGNDKHVVYRKAFSSKLGYPMVFQDSRLIAFTRIPERCQLEEMKYEMKCPVVVPEHN